MPDEAREEDAEGMFRPKEIDSRCRSSARHGRLRTSVLSGGKKQSGADGTDAEVHRGMCGVRERTCKEVFSRLPAGIIWHKSLFIMGLESF